MNRMGTVNWPRCVGLFLVLTVSSLAAEPVDTVQRLSGFRQLDVSRLLAGEILTERGAMMDFPNGISAQSCFAVARPAAEVARRIQFWDPTPHPELKVLAFHAVPVPGRPDDFAQLQFTAPLKPVRWLLEKTLATTPTKSALNVSRSEAADLGRTLAVAATPQRVADCWAQLLAARVVAFQQQQWVGVTPYEMAGPATAPGTQLRSLLAEQTGIAVEFAPVLRQTGLAGEAVAAPAEPFYYWSWFEANRHATVALGAVYRVPAGECYQVADVQYYVSNDYYTAVTLYEIWPVPGGALVWRVDLFAAPMLAFTKGVERLAYEVLMVQDIKQETRCMLSDLKAN